MATREPCKGRRPTKATAQKGLEHLARDSASPLLLASSAPALPSLAGFLRMFGDGLFRRRLLELESPVQPTHRTGDVVAMNHTGNLDLARRDDLDVDAL